MKRRTRYWCGVKFVYVTKEEYKNFCRFFKDKLEHNAFMGWCDAYDFSLASKKYRKGSWEYLDECNVGRHYFESPDQEYWIRIDYIEKHNYDLSTIVPEEETKPLPKNLQILADHICDAIDYAFQQECMRNLKK